MESSNENHEGTYNGQKVQSPQSNYQRYIYEGTDSQYAPFSQHRTSQH